MTRSWIAAVLVTALFAAAVLSADANITLAPRVPPYLPVPEGAAVILDTGSTNSAGYRVVVQQQGEVEYVAANRRAEATITAATATKFFADLKAAAPLDRLPSQHCMKSVSFGTSLYVWWWEHGRSPDLNCPADTRSTALHEDVAQIAKELGLSGMQPVMRPLMPGEQHKPLPPAPNPSPA